MGVPLSGLLENIYVENLENWADHLNSYDRNWQFILEVQIENKLPFLDGLLFVILINWILLSIESQCKTIDIFILIQVTPTS